MSLRNVFLKSREDLESQSSFKRVDILTGLDFKYPDGKTFFFFFLKALAVISQGTLSNATSFQGFSSPEDMHSNQGNRRL